MKKQLYILAAFFMVFFCQAQVSMSQAEYFWDADPGQGNATAILATDGNFNSAFEKLSKTGITAPSAGLHKFSIRVKDNTGVWGPVFTSVINVAQLVTATTVSISQAEYFWDADPGQGNGTAVLAFDGNFNNAFERFSTSVSFPSTVGLHVFNVRIKDNTNVWGPVFKNVITVKPSLGTDDLEALHALKIYPNPVDNILTISFSNEITAVSIYNLLGQEVIAKTINANEAKVDVSKLSAGTYLVKVQADNQAKTLKIIKR